MPFGMGPAGWAYVSPYAYPYVGAPYLVWSWWVAGEEAVAVVGVVGLAGAGLHPTGTRGDRNAN